MGASCGPLEPPGEVLGHPGSLLGCLLGPPGSLLESPGASWASWSSPKYSSVPWEIETIVRSEEHISHRFLIWTSHAISMKKKNVGVSPKNVNFLAVSKGLSE